MRGKPVAVLLSILAFWSADYAIAQQRCGGTERWAVKLATDPDAANIDRTNIRDATVSDLNQLPQLRGNVPAGDNETRLEEERVVYRVSGRLVLFKFEDDDDYHLVITDDSLRYTPGGKGTVGQETGTSFIAEIPNPQCYMGKHGDFNRRSELQDALQQTRIKFEQRFPGGQDADTDLGGIPVTVTGVAFYDRQHLQTGRAINGIEAHPLLDIVINDLAPSVAALTPAIFGGQQPTTALFTKTANTWSVNRPALRESSEAGDDDDDDLDENSVRIGGNGQPQVDSIWQTTRIANAPTANLRLSLRIKTDNKATSPSADTLAIQVRTVSGKLLKTIARFSNAQASRRSRLITFDLAKYRGKTVRLQFTSQEKSTKATRFIISNARIEYR
jgi:hypothetical protein